jgi:hypothetical protein
MELCDGFQKCLLDFTVLHALAAEGTEYTFFCTLLINDKAKPQSELGTLDDAFMDVLVAESIGYEGETAQRVMVMRQQARHSQLAILQQKGHIHFPEIPTAAPRMYSSFSCDVSSNISPEN